jgi:drug/metabolite transporter (DMT)-like permease
LAGIANSTTPLFAVLLGMLVLPDQALSRVQSAALALGFLGVVVILQPWRVEGRPDLGGFAIALAASASYAVGWTYVRRRLTADDVGGLALPTGQVLCGAMQLTLAVVLWWALAPGSAATGWHPNGHLLPALLAVTTLGALGTGVAMAFQFDVVRQVGPTIATTVTYLIPVVAVAMGHLVLGEGLSGVQLLGAGVVLASAVLLGLPRRTMADDGEEG